MIFHFLPQMFRISASHVKVLSKIPSAAASSSSYSTAKCKERHQCCCTGDSVIRSCWLVDSNSCESIYIQQQYHPECEYILYYGFCFLISCAIKMRIVVCYYLSLYSEGCSNKVIKMLRLYVVTRELHVTI